MPKLLEEELSYAIRGCIYATANKYGKGLKEIIYQNALAEEFDKNNIKYEQQQRINIFSLETGKKLGTYIPDFIVEDRIIIEIKASSFTRKEDINQQRSYLRASKYEIGFLANFCSENLDLIRSIHTNDKKSFLAKLNRN